MYFKLDKNIKYFSSDSNINNSYLEDYNKLKNNMGIDYDLYFFDPNKFKCKSEAENLNQFTLADYMDLVYIDKISKYSKKTNDDLLKYTINMDSICNYILLNNSNNVNFKPAIEINELIKNFKNVLLDTSITDIFISSGSMHAMRYSWAFETFNEDDLSKIEQNLKNTNLTIIYGPFSLLEEDESNHFIKFLFDKKINFSLKRDDSKDYRNHFFYTINKNKEYCIVFETAHREYLIRRNIIELKSSNININDIIFGKNGLLDEKRFSESVTISSYKDFILSDYSENIRDYFSFFKSSNRYLKFKEKHITDKK